MPTTLFSLLIFTLTASCLLQYRVFTSGSHNFFFLHWNLALAWIPYLLSLLLLKLDKAKRFKWQLLLMVGGLWLFFLPNAPYIITDFYHLKPRSNIPLWFDMGMLATYAILGLFLGLISMFHVHQLLNQYCSKIISWLLMTLFTLLSGYGIFLGRFLRWNSWEIVSDPINIVSQGIGQLLYAEVNSKVYGVTLIYFALLMNCYLLFYSIKGTRGSRS